MRSRVYVRRTCYFGNLPLVIIRTTALYVVLVTIHNTQHLAMRQFIRDTKAVAQYSATDTAAGYTYSY